MKKITKATFKSFIKKHEGNMFIQYISDFDGMTDCVEYTPANQRKFIPLQKDTIEENDYKYGESRGRTREEVEAAFFNNKNSLGYKGIWLVNHSRDSFRVYEDDQYEGINVYNCCGQFTIAIQKRV